MKCKLNYCKSL